MKTVCDTLKVSRSNIIERIKNKKKVRRPYQKPDDNWLLPMILGVVDERPTYGYRRVHEMLNRQLLIIRKSKINHKRVYRIMKQNQLLLTRHKGQKQTPKHEGQIITLNSNMRWCSDVFEIPCFNGDVVRVVFSLDCCDRELMSHVATSGWIDAQMIRDLMFQTMEYRFGAIDKLPHKIEWLTDNGKYYLAKDTLRFAKKINLIPCTTAPYSPQSNGMAEALVKTIKRDYVYVKDRPDARTVISQLPNWFEDYNEHHPHKGLKMRSPRGYLRDIAG